MGRNCQWKGLEPLCSLFIALYFITYLLSQLLFFSAWPQDHTHSYPPYFPSYFTHIFIFKYMFIIKAMYVNCEKLKQYIHTKNKKWHLSVISCSQVYLSPHQRYYPLYPPLSIQTSSYTPTKVWDYILHTFKKPAYRHTALICINILHIREIIYDFITLFFTESIMNFLFSTNKSTSLFWKAASCCIV